MAVPGEPGDACTEKCVASDCANTISGVGERSLDSHEIGAGGGSQSSKGDIMPPPAPTELWRGLGGTGNVRTGRAEKRK